MTRRIRLERETLPDDLDLTGYSGVIVGGGPGCVSDPPERKTPLEARIEAQIMGLMPRIADGDAVSGVLLRDRHSGPVSGRTRVAG